MKRLLLVAVTAIMLSSCQKEEENTPVPVAATPVVVTQLYSGVGFVRTVSTTIKVYEGTVLKGSVTTVGNNCTTATGFFDFKNNVQYTISLNTAQTPATTSSFLIDDNGVMTIGNSSFLQQENCTSYVVRVL